MAGFSLPSFHQSKSSAKFRRFVSGSRAANPPQKTPTTAQPFKRIRFAFALGIVPPAGAEAAHAELRAALAEARDATGEVAGALADGDADAVAALVHEWRGALFRVRLARHRLLERAQCRKRVVRIACAR